MYRVTYRVGKMKEHCRAERRGRGDFYVSSGWGVRVSGGGIVRVLACIYFFLWILRSLNVLFYFSSNGTGNGRADFLYSAQKRGGEGVKCIEGGGLLA